MDDSYYMCKFLTCQKNKHLLPKYKQKNTNMAKNVVKLYWKLQQSFITAAQYKHMTISYFTICLLIHQAFLLLNMH